MLKDAQSKAPKARMNSECSRNIGKARFLTNPQDRTDIFGYFA